MSNTKEEFVKTNLASESRHANEHSFANKISVCLCTNTRRPMYKLPRSEMAQMCMDGATHEGR